MLTTLDLSLENRASKFVFFDKHVAQTSNPIACVLQIKQDVHLANRTSRRHPDNIAG